MGGPWVRVVQPNIQSQPTWDPGLRWQYLDETLTTALTGAAEKGIPATVVLPETAVAFFLEQQPDVATYIAQRTPPGMAWLTGTVHREESLLGPRFYNSLAVVSDTGVVTGRYDKHLLVPFGEFVPLRATIEDLPLPVALRTLSQSRLDFTHGMRFAPLETPAGPVAGLICYEGIFPFYVSTLARGARWLVNVTNDSWFTGTIALYQHAALETLRAVETGLPLVRSANTGLSFVVDPYGRPLHTLPVGKPGFMDFRLPEPLPTPWFTKLIQLARS
jgi:apolipoprotein N-acyltransferase